MNVIYSLSKINEENMIFFSYIFKQQEKESDPPKS